MKEGAAKEQMASRSNITPLCQGSCRLSSNSVRGGERDVNSLEALLRKIQEQDDRKTARSPRDARLSPWPNRQAYALRRSIDGCAKLGLHCWGRVRISVS